MIIGLAPGLHGANRTGIPFTGDASGHLLFRNLLKFGFAIQENEGNRLLNTRISNAVRCLPPANKPVASEINACQVWLKESLGSLEPNALLLCLGHIAHRAVVKALGERQSAYPFAHGRMYASDNGLVLLDSYHCSRYNIQTGRLSIEAFEDIFRQAQEYLNK